MAGWRRLCGIMVVLGWLRCYRQVIRSTFATSSVFYTGSLRTLAQTTWPLATCPSASHRICSGRCVAPGQPRCSSRWAKCRRSVNDSSSPLPKCSVHAVWNCSALLLRQSRRTVAGLSSSVQTTRVNSHLVSGCVLQAVLKLDWKQNCLFLHNPPRRTVQRLHHSASDSLLVCMWLALCKLFYLHTYLLTYSVGINAPLFYLASCIMAHY